METVAIWTFRPVQLAGLPAESLASLQELSVMLRKVPSCLMAIGFDPYCWASSLNAFGIGAFALRHCPGEVPTISRKPRLNAGRSQNPISNATVSKDSFECNNRDFAASTRL